MKARDEGGRKILLGDNIGDGAVMLWPLGFQRVGIFISAGLPGVYIYCS
jgi:hypothetical protein